MIAVSSQLPQSMPTAQIHLETSSWRIFPDDFRQCQTVNPNHHQIHHVIITQLDYSFKCLPDLGSFWQAAIGKAE